MPPLLPSPSQLARLTNEQTKSVVEAINQANEREHKYAVLAMQSGLISFVLVIFCFTLLVLRGHEVAAGVVLGSGVLSVIGKMVGSRTSTQKRP